MTAQDLRIAELAMKAGCATALVLNKWDLTGGDVDQIARGRAAASAPPSSTASARRVNRKLRLRPKVLTASAVTGRNVAPAAAGGAVAQRPRDAPDSHP